MEKVKDLFERVIVFFLSFYCQAVASSCLDSTQKAIML
jgi:hypothetical protein